MSPNAPPNPGPASDPDEYELEAPDEGVTESARRRTAEHLKQAADSLEIERAELATEHRGVFDPEESFSFQFQIKHALIATAVLAVVFTLMKLFNGVSVLLLATLGGLVAAHWYLGWVEKKRLAEAAARRDEVVRRVMGRSRESRVDASPTMYDEQLQAADEQFREAVDQHAFKLNFSFQDMMLAVTVAAVVMGLGKLIHFKIVSVALGLVAVTGLLAFAVGVRPPSKVVLVWWVTLSLYILICVLQVVGVIGVDA